MKKVFVIILAVFGVVLGTGLAASAAYPPTTPKVTLLPTGPITPGVSVPVEVTNVAPNATVTVTLNGVTYTVKADATGKASLTVVAPAKTGAFDLTVSSPGSATVIKDFIVTAAVTTTVAPTTAAPTTVAPTTAAPTTAAPTTVAPTTKPPMPPVTSLPDTGSDTPFKGAAVGIPMLAVGLVLLVVSRRRRTLVA